MPGSYAEEIVAEYFESEWPDLATDEAEPDLDLPPLPTPRPQPSAR